MSSMERFSLSSLCGADRKKPKLLGRGIGSTKGKTSGRGQKGAGARAGRAAKPFFEGGQTPLYRRLPKRGFNSLNDRSNVCVISLPMVAKFLDSGSLSDEVSLDVLKSNGVAKKSCKLLRVIGVSELRSKIVVKAAYITPGAKDCITRAGGSVEAV